MTSLTKQSGSSNTSSSSSNPRLNYDVFLSFRGEDTRNTFTGHLYNALTQAGIRTFMDEPELRRGDEISSSLVRAIEESRVAIIVVSRNYASSRWCLDELVKILDCRRTTSQLVVPIFYDVVPSDVRHQTGSFQIAFEGHEQRFAAQMEIVARWRAALTEAANLSGYDTTTNRNEAHLIHAIVEMILLEVKPSYLNVEEHPVGIYYRAMHTQSLLSIETDDVRIIGIHGMGGVGKTVVAKAVYNLIFHHFEGRSFVANVREVSKQINGIVRLQELLLSEILKNKVKVASVDEGINLIMERLHSKRVLIVFDDIDNYLSQVKSLAGDRNWFGSGSRIIITTRDVHLLDQVPVDARYEVERLNYTESMELLGWHAFRKKFPLLDYMNLSKEIVSYVDGLPLALKIIGSHLFQRNKIAWRSAIEKLRQIPHKEIQGKLKISFDGLDNAQKAIFLDIACFFIGMNKDEVISILKACGFFPEIEIDVLKERSLLTFDETNRLMMHDLIRDMGRDIICEPFPDEPGKCSRLWLYEEVYDVLKKHKGTEAIEGAILDLYSINEVKMSTKTFERMHKLRLLKINNLVLSGSFDNLFEELRWLCWHYCPLQYLPPDFHPEKLVILDISSSNIQNATNGFMALPNLKILNLSDSTSLTKTPDFTGSPLLETLLLEGCTSLFEIHPSIGLLSKLVYLNMRDCNSLKNLPENICNLSSLQCLNLCGCTNLDSLPENLGTIDCLNELLADGTSIKRLPDSIGFLLHLKVLSLKGCKRDRKANTWFSRFSLSSQRKYNPRFFPLLSPNFCSLRRLDLQDCNLSDRDLGDLHDELGKLSSVEELNLGGNNFYSLPQSFNQLDKLRELSFSGCKFLRSLPELPSNLQKLNARDCSSIIYLPNLSKLSKLEKLVLTNCSMLPEVQGLKYLFYLKAIDMAGCTSMVTNFDMRFFQELCERQIPFSIVLPITEIPDWFSHQSKGSSCSFDVPYMLLPIKAIKKMTLWVVYTNYGSSAIEHPILAVIKNKTNNTMWTHNGFLPETLEINSWVSDTPESHTIKAGDRIEVQVIETNEIVMVEAVGLNLDWYFDQLNLDWYSAQTSDTLSWLLD